ncbi:hypothetical protein QBE55_00530 [Eubacteriales bacterium mix99]|jgi:predicted TIM-barrel fold metal-dependent hydrolase|nr:hypothetical protein [Clostridiales bacterium]
MDSLKFFDCHCSFGMRSIRYPGSFYQKEDLIRKMKSCGIEKALVYHSMAQEYNPEAGNQMLMEAVQGIPSLIPVWAVMPHHTGEFPEPDELARRMKENAIQAVTMFPGAADQTYSMAEWNCGGLYGMLEEQRVPLLLGMEQTAWNDLQELLSRHPQLNVILTNVNYRIDRNLYAMLEKHDHLFLETYGYKVYGGIEAICRRFGARRLIFGSGMPVFSGSGAVSMINYAQISEEEKREIAYKNLENLLKGVRQA